MKSVCIIGLILLACATTGMQKKEAEAPLTLSIAASKETVYQVTATKLMEHGFMIESSDPSLGRITTGYADLHNVMGEALLSAFAGLQNFKVNISTQIIYAEAGQCDLIMRGVGQYEERKGLFRPNEIRYQPVRKGTPAYKNMEQIASEIKEEAEKSMRGSK